MKDIKIGLLAYSVKHHSIGIKCKACDAPLGARSIDTELCNDCMEWVIDYNRDLENLEEGPEYDYSED